MKNLFFIPVLFIFVLLSGCSKEPAAGPISGTNWAGVYVADPQSASTLTQIQISNASGNALKIVLKVEQFSYVYTATTLQSVAVTSGTTATINENEEIIENTDLGLYAFKGTVTINGTHVTLNATATNLGSGASSENSPMNFTFSGDKAQ